MLVTRCNKKIFEIYFLINYMIIKKIYKKINKIIEEIYIIFLKIFFYDSYNISFFLNNKINYKKHISLTKK